MTRSATRAFRASVAVVFLTGFAFADTVTLKNGDKLTGTIGEVSPERIVVMTPYAGKVMVERSAVRTLQSDHLVTVLRADGTRQERYLSPATQPAGGAAATPATQTAATGWRETEAPVIPPTGVAPPAVVVAPEKSDTKNKRSTHYLDLGPDWKNTLAVGAINSSGNDETTSLSADLTLHYQKKEDEVTVKFQSLYGTSQGSQTAGLVDENTVYRHDLTSRWYTYASDDVRYDDIKGISLQAQASGGLGYYFFRGERFKLDVRSGPGVSYLKTFDDRSNLAPSVEAGVRLAYQVNDHLKASHETTYTTSLFDSEVWRVHSETALNYKLDLERGLGLKLAYNDDYENRPSRNRRKNDSRVSLSLTLDF
jgi:putative salt-induced outer membrane protein YdiY